MVRKFQAKILPLVTFCCINFFCLTKCCRQHIPSLGLHLTIAIQPLTIQGGPKSKPPPILKKIVLKIASEITFLRKVKV